MLWRRACRRYGPGRWNDMHKNRVRHAFMLVSVAVSDDRMPPHAKSIAVLKAHFEGLCWWIMAETVKSKTRHFGI